MKDQNVNRIKEIFEETTGIGIQNLDPEEDFREATNVDSVQFVGFLSRVEKEFKIELPMSVMESKNLNDFLHVFNEQFKK